MIEVKSSGSFKKTEKFLRSMQSGDVYDILNQYGQEGLDALSAATPSDTGLTALSWTYEVVRENHDYSIVFSNNNIIEGMPLAIMLQYGHGTGTGGWVQGIDYINPALKPLFEKIANDVWEKVKHG